MKKVMIVLTAIVVSIGCNRPTYDTVIIDDVTNFWIAYDLIQNTKDTSTHMSILNKAFFDKGTDGLKAIMEKKRYTKKEYLEAIRTYPSFWNSIKENTLKASEFSGAIEVEIDKLRSYYPELRPAHIYFTMGVLKSGGTAHDGHVLIGSEVACADSTVVTADIKPDWLRENHERYFGSNPIKDIVLLNVHEYVHTQQSVYGYNLLSQSIYEGVAEFVSVLSHGGSSTSPAVGYALKNKETVRNRFEKEMFSPHWNDWLYNNNSNDFGLRDMGYGVGYAICKAYYDQASDKKSAIKKMIELNYQDQEAVESFSMESGYFSKPIDQLKMDYESSRPSVLGIKQFNNGDKNVDPHTSFITVEFSRSMSTRFINHKLDPQGRGTLLPIEGIKWSDDQLELTYQVNLEPEKRYLIILDDELRATDGPNIEKYLIDFTTAAL